jgi:predicted ABC-type ATPase
VRLVAAANRPTLHIIVGPNGAGKSTLYANRIQPYFPKAEFVNADLLVLAAIGHPAITREQSEQGQQLAEQRRAILMAQGKDFVTESTFSHPSKLDLIREAKALGYFVRIYHVNLTSSDLAVKRVARRVSEGGHPVPELKIRERYARNQALIYEAIQLADRASVFDNSKFGEPHRRILAFKNGKLSFVDTELPMWAKVMYQNDDLAAYTKLLAYLSKALKQ